MRWWELFSLHELSRGDATDESDSQISLEQLRRTATCLECFPPLLRSLHGGQLKEDPTEACALTLGESF